MMTHYIHVYVHDVPSRVHVAELLGGAATAIATAAAVRYMYLFFDYCRIILGICRTRP